MTETKLFSNQALFALDDTTPVETTQAVLLKHHCFFSVASFAAQQITATYVHGCAVAYTPLCSQWSRFSICKTEIRRLVRVDQILLVRWLYILADGDQGLAVIAAHHFGSAVEPLQQAVTHFAEMGHLFPACAQGARAWQSMALALSPHVELYCLIGERVDEGVGLWFRVVQGKREVKEGKQV